MDLKATAKQLAKQMLKQMIKKLLKAALKKLVMTIIKYVVALVGPEVAAVLLIVILLGGIFGALASGDYNDTGSSSSQSNQQVVQPYKDAAKEVNPPVDSSDGYGGGNADPYQLDWGILYAIDTLGGNLPMDDSALEPHVKAMAKALAPIYTYEDKSVTQTQNGKTTHSSQRVLTKVDTYTGAYTFNYTLQTINYQNGNDTYSRTQYVLSGVTNTTDHTRLKQAIKQFTNMTTVSDSDLTMVLQLAKGIDQQRQNLDWMLSDNPMALGNDGAFIGEVPASMMDAFQKASQRFGISEYILIAIAKKESTFDPNAIGPLCADGQRAEGLMQFKPTTWALYGIDGDGDGKANIFDANDSIYSAANYLHYLLGVVGDLHTAVKDYGEGTDAYADEIFASAAQFEQQFKNPGNGKYLWPVQGTSFANITQMFGNPDGSPHGHNGLDIGASEGTPIIAMVNGTIQQLGDESTDPAGGNSIFLHGIDGNYWYFAHLSAFNVQTGQKVKAGDVIGYVGQTGHADGPHLHLGLITNGRFSNPLTWVDPLTKYQK